MDICEQQGSERQVGSDSSHARASRAPHFFLSKERKKGVEALLSVFVVSGSCDDGVNRRSTLMLDVKLVAGGKVSMFHTTTANRGALNAHVRDALNAHARALRARARRR